MRIFGVDFTSAPRKSKPIVVAGGRLRRSGLEILDIEKLESFEAFEAMLNRPGPWVGAFDFPFGLPREAVTALNLPTEWRDLARQCRAWGKAEFKARLDRYRESRPHGNRYATRAGDSASGAHPAVKLVNPPVGLMFFEGAPRLVAANLTVPRLSAGDSSRIALEAYPGMFVRKHLQILDSYKNDRRSKQSRHHRRTRLKIVRAIKLGRPHGIRVMMSREIESEMVDDGAGDSLDAAICAIQASWGARRGAPAYGLPVDVDPVEGWIVTAGA